MNHLKKKYFLISLGLIILTGCENTSMSQHHNMYYLFSKPMTHLLDFLASIFNYNYGVAIIVIVFILRLIMLPFMLVQSKNSELMRKKMTLLEPKISVLKKKLHHAQSQEEKHKLNHEIIDIYRTNEINPARTVLGCLPLLIQMPILFGLYVSLKWPVNEGLILHSNFLWFNLSQPDLIITIIAGLLYFIQPLVSSKTLPKKQRFLSYIMAVISPIFIIYISLTSPSALGLYWTINAGFLIIQIVLTHRYFLKNPTNESLDINKMIHKV
ncbi:membrane protein insertase YidC [Staphylococcus hyicus]|uniref:membrane protein insertase YidC n=1 Tax=Staphylococcus hyicus TaxID=1284 RepID=UPI0036D3B9D5